MTHCSGGQIDPNVDINVGIGIGLIQAYKIDSLVEYFLNYANVHFSPFIKVSENISYIIP